MAKYKVTWTTSQRIHATIDGKTTICGHVFDGPDRSVHGQLHKYKRKRHCRTCFVEKPDFKAPWLPACEEGHARMGATKGPIIRPKSATFAHSCPFFSVERTIP